MQRGRSPHQVAQDACVCLHAMASHWRARVSLVHGWRSRCQWCPCLGYWPLEF